MNNFDFTSVPVIGNIMSITGIQDGWVVIGLFLLILAVVFLAGWIASAKSARTSKRELDELRDEVMGLKALTNLPPLHSDEYGNSGDSLVFASAKEIRRRQMAEASAQATEAMPVVAATRQHVFEETQPLSVPVPETAATKQAGTDPSVTAQVHNKIYASVTKDRPSFKASTASAEPSGREDMVGNRKRKANGAAITSSDLPPIVKPGSQTKRNAKLQRKSKPSSGNLDSDNPSLSSRIPKL